MFRSDPNDPNDTIFRYREMYFTRLKSDSIVGTKGHWYMYLNDKESVVYEDIYDGTRLIRKNNQDSIARIYDLIKYPEFKKKHFGGHNTLFEMQFEFRYILQKTESFDMEKLTDTIINGKKCYQILIRLENHVTMPGFAISLEKRDGNISETRYFISKDNYYPLGMLSEFYNTDNPDIRVFMGQKYYDILLNQKIEEDQYNTSESSLSGFEIQQIKPD